MGTSEQLGRASHKVGPGKRTRVYYRARGCDTVSTTVHMKMTPVPYPATATSEAAPPSSRTSWTGWLRKVFSFPSMCMLLLASVIFGYAPRGIGIGESDIWWHLLNARNLLQNHSFSRIDTHSFTVLGKPWVNFEWLSEIPFFLAFKAMGLQGIVAVYSTVMVLIFAGVYYRACKAGADCKSAAVATLAGICIGCVSLAPRTLLFGWLCMTALLLILDQFKRTGKGLWLLPPLFTLWINLHGSWVFGMVVLVATIASGLVEGEWGLVMARRWTPCGVEKTTAGIVRFASCALCQSFRLQTGTVPIRLYFPSARRNAGLRILASCGLQHLEWQAGANPDFCVAGGRLVFPPPLEAG